VLYWTCITPQGNELLKSVSSLVISVLLSGVLLLAGCQLTARPTTSMPPGARGGVLNLYGTDPTTLDPAVGAEANSIEYILQIFGGLVSLDKDLAPVADIARTWDISGDGKTYTFHLRDDAKFQNGRAVKAQDFKYSWERACGPATGSSTAATYLGDVVGVREVLAGQAQDISGVKALDDVTLQVTIAAPKTYFLFKLTYPVAFVVDRENVQTGREWWRKPNGTGPFRVKEWTTGSKFVLERHGSFYGKTADLDSVVFHLLAGLPMNMYETGDIDVAGVAMPYVERVADRSGPFFSQLVITPELSFFYVGFNAARPPFDDANVRRAFSMALDKDKLVSLVFQGTVAKATGIVPPGIEGFNEAVTSGGFDPARARELIRQSRYGDVSKLPPITLTTGGEGGAVSGWLQAAVYQWRENLGVEVKIRQLESERFFYSLRAEKDDMFDLGWIADYPHQQDFLEVLFRGGSEVNYGEYRNPEVDALLDEAGVEPDKNRSIGLYRQAEQKLIEDAACLPLWFGRNYLLVRPYVKNYRVNPLGFAMLNLVSIEK
jgi:oligopeptide transport system substrate-binding protein